MRKSRGGEVEPLYEGNGLLSLNNEKLDSKLSSQRWRAATRTYSICPLTLHKVKPMQRKASKSGDLGATLRKSVQQEQIWLKPRKSSYNQNVFNLNLSKLPWNLAWWRLIQKRNLLPDWRSTVLRHRTSKKLSTTCPVIEGKPPMLESSNWPKKIALRVSMKMNPSFLGSRDRAKTDKAKRFESVRSHSLIILVNRCFKMPHKHRKLFPRIKFCKSKQICKDKFHREKLTKNSCPSL